MRKQYIVETRQYEKTIHCWNQAGIAVAIVVPKVFDLDLFYIAPFYHRYSTIFYTCLPSIMLMVMIIVHNDDDDFGKGPDKS